MSFQVHSEFVKVAELTLLELKHHLFPERGNSGFPSSPALPCWLSRVLSAWQTRMCLRDCRSGAHNWWARQLALNTASNSTQFCSGMAAATITPQYSPVFLQGSSSMGHCGLFTLCLASRPWVTPRCLGRPPSLMLMISDLQAVGFLCKECQMEPAGRGAVCCLCPLLSWQQEQSFPWN